MNHLSVQDGGCLRVCHRGEGVFFDTCIRRDLCDVDVDGNGATDYEHDGLPGTVWQFSYYIFLQVE